MQFDFAEMQQVRGPQNVPSFLAAVCHLRQISIDRQPISSILFFYKVKEHVQWLKGQRHENSKMDWWYCGRTCAHLSTYRSCYA